MFEYADAFKQENKYLLVIKPTFLKQDHLILTILNKNMELIDIEGLVTLMKHCDIPINTLIEEIDAFVKTQRLRLLFLKEEQHVPRTARHTSKK